MPLLYRVKTEFTGLPGMPALNQLYFDGAGGSPSDAVSAVGAFWTACSLQMYDEIQMNVQADVEVIESTTGEIVSVASTPGATAVGANASDFLPTASQGLIRLRTGEFFGGRELRGKIYVPGMTEAASVAGQMANASATVLQNAADQLANDIGQDLVVYSRTKGVFANVSSVSVWNQFAVLRSRRD